MDFDWLDNFLENVDGKAEDWQLDSIDNLIRSCTLDVNEIEKIEMDSYYYTQKEAAIAIAILKRNQDFRDPRDKFKFYINKYN